MNNNNNDLCRFCFSVDPPCHPTCLSNNLPPAQRVAIEQKFKGNHVVAYMIKVRNGEDRMRLMHTWTLEEYFRAIEPRRGITGFHDAVVNETQQVSSRLQELRALYGVVDEATAAGVAAAMAANPEPPANEIQAHLLGPLPAVVDTVCPFCGNKGFVCLQNCPKWVGGETMDFIGSMEGALEKSYICHIMRRIGYLGGGVDVKKDAIHSYGKELRFRDIEPIEGLWGSYVQEYRERENVRAQIEVYEQIHNNAQQQAVDWANMEWMENEVLFPEEIDNWNLYDDVQDMGGQGEENNNPVVPFEGADVAGGGGVGGMDYMVDDNWVFELQEVAQAGDGNNNNNNNMNVGGQGVVDNQFDLFQFVAHELFFDFDDFDLDDFDQ